MLLFSKIYQKGFLIEVVLWFAKFQSLPTTKVYHWESNYLFKLIYKESIETCSYEVYYIIVYNISFICCILYVPVLKLWCLDVKKHRKSAPSKYDLASLPSIYKHTYILHAYGNHKKVYSHIVHSKTYLQVTIYTYYQKIKTSRPYTT